MRIGSLGDIIFEVSAEKVLTPSEFSREHTARYEQHNVLGALPRLEFLSADLESTTLPIRLRASALTLQSINALSLISFRPFTQSWTRNATTPTDKTGVSGFLIKFDPLKALPNFLFHEGRVSAS